MLEEFSLTTGKGQPYVGGVVSPTIGKGKLCWRQRQAMLEVLSHLLQAKVSYVGGVVSPTRGKGKLCMRSSLPLQAKVSYVGGVLSY